MNNKTVSVLILITGLKMFSNENAHLGKIIERQKGNLRQTGEAPLKAKVKSPGIAWCDANAPSLRVRDIKITSSKCYDNNSFKPNMIACRFSGVACEWTNGYAGIKRIECYTTNLPADISKYAGKVCVSGYSNSNPITVKYAQLTGKTACKDLTKAEREKECVAIVKKHVDYLKAQKNEDLCEKRAFEEIDCE